MKKFLTLAMLATMLIGASCARTEEMSSESGLKATVTFTVAADQPATRAVEAVKGTATRLWVGVYLRSGENNYTWIETLDQTKEVATWPTTLSVDLARNETYKLVFWADEGDDAFTITKSSSIVAESATTKDGNLANRDAYYKVIEITPAGSMSGEVVLTRPMAQINVGTSDLAAFKAASMFEGKVKTEVVVEGVATAMNLLTGAASGDAGTMTFSFADERGTELSAGEEEYDYLVANYVLAPAGVTASATVSMSKDGTTNINSFEVTNLPVKTNYRTNIVGKLLTGTVTYSVNVDQNFTDDLDKEVAPGFASVAALNAYFETLEDNSDNGDINPEEVTLSAISDGDEIVLPKVAENLVIRVNGKLSSGSLTIKYADGAADGQKPENIDLFFAELDNLILNTPDSHVELLAGSILNSAEVYTSGDTFVVQTGAKVGALNIAQGNAEIAGEVEIVAVAENATADGGEAPVEVFVANTAAVEQITLSAPTDVKVEQPKDNIDESDTEYKVAVQVNVDGCSATAQNGGQIYVSVAAGVSCSVAADGESATEEVSQITIASTGAGSSVSTFVNNGGQIDTATHSSDIAENTVAEPVEGVAKIGSKVYPSLKAAIAGAESEDTITLIADENVSLTDGGEIEINKALTITGATATNGEPLYTIYGKSSVTGTNDIFITGSGNVTLANLKVKNFGNDANTDMGHAPIYVSTNYTGTATLSNVYVSDFNRGGIFLYGGAFNVDNCYIDCANPRSGAFTKGIEIKGSAHGTISDTFICNMERSGSDSPAGIEIYGNGSIEVDNCTIVSDNGDHAAKKATYGIATSKVGEHDPSGGTTHINECMFSCTNACLSVADSDAYGPVNNYSFIVDECEFDNYIATWSTNSSITINSGSFAEDVYADAGTIIINGGEFSSFAPDTDTGSIIIYGGTFDADPTPYVAEGYQAVKDGDNWIIEASFETSEVGGNTVYSVLKPAGLATVLSKLSSATGDVTVNLNANTFDMVNKSLSASGKTVKFVGEGEQTILNFGSGNNASHGVNVQFENLTIQKAGINYVGFQHSASESYKNVHFEGTVWTYAPVVTFDSCSFDVESSDSYNVWLYGGCTATIKDCEFECEGKSILVYNETGTTEFDVTIDGCEFTANQPKNGKAAIELHAELVASGYYYTASIKNCTINGFSNGSLSGQSVWNYTSGSEDNLNVTAENNTVN